MDCVCGFNHGERVKFVHECILEEGNYRLLSYLKKCMTKVKDSMGLESLNLRLQNLEDILSRLDIHADRDDLWEILSDDHTVVDALFWEDLDVTVSDDEVPPDDGPLILRNDGQVIDIEQDLPDVVQTASNLPDLIQENDGARQEN